MKKMLLFILMPLCFLSCHKSKRNNCTGSIVYVGGLSNGGAGGVSSTLYSIDPNTGQTVNNYQTSIILASSPLLYVCDNIHDCYYAYNGYVIGFYYNNGTNINLGIGCNITDSNWVPKYLVCNSTATKLYSFGQVNSVNKIYEINTTADVGVRQIFVADTQTKITTPVIDENTGAIYFFSKPNIMKVDSSGGAASIVATYNSTVPGNLQFNKNDGMFYGFDMNAQTFIRINPQNGAVTTISEAHYPYLTFDICDNIFIMSNESGIYWVTPANGEIVKTINADVNGGNIFYIN